MKKIILIIFNIVLFLSITISQNFNLNYDFENPQQLNDWQQATSTDFSITSTSPINGASSLQHNSDNTSGVKQAICLQFNNIVLDQGTSTWMFKIKYDNSNPSGSNKFYVYLMSDKNYAEMIDPSGSNLNGYVFGVNYGSATDDFVKIWRIKNGTGSTMLTTTMKWNSNHQNKNIAVKITRNSFGLWEIFADTLTGDFNNVVSLGTANNTEITDFQFFGFTYFFTSTFVKKIWFDDFSFSGFKIVDTIKPTLNSIQTLTQNSVKLTFSEIISTTTANNTSNYFADNGLGNPSTAEQDINDKKNITLTFNQNFIQDQIYNLTIKNLTDLENNTINDTTVPFVWQKPAFEKIRFVDYNKVDLYFTKELEITSAENTSNYNISDTIIPSQATLDAVNKKIVHLLLPQNLKNKTNYNLLMQNISDIYSNFIAPTNYQFTFYLPQPYDVIINELMVDVSPAPIALPPYKYIEIYNLTNYPIDLTDWKLKIGTNSEITFTPIVLNPQGYALICSPTAANAFEPYSIVIPTLVESQLTSTTGKTIILKDNNSNIIEQITYDPKSWYQDPVKDDGGWSMERIDPTNICSQDNNWQASQSYTGGTPGIINSIIGSNPDKTPPSIVNFKVVTSHDIMIEFSEIIDAQIALQQINYLLNSYSIPLKVKIDANNPAKVFIYFVQHFPYSSNQIKISGIKDYCGNKMKDSTIQFDYQLIYPKDVEPKSDYQLKIYFSEPVSKSTSQNYYSYSVNNNIGNPTVAVRDPNDSSIVHLQFSDKFINNKQYILTIFYVSDLYGHQMTTANISFTYHIPQLNDIVFNELMLDVNPAPAGLPACQYIELFNTTQYNIWLTDWQFIAEGQSARTFPTVKIPSRNFAIICQSENEKLLKSYGNTIPILGSSDLTQSGKKIEIYDHKSNLITTLRYSSRWYNDDKKDNGGWSLEKIDPDNFCETYFNWTVCNDILGGTPAKDNSVFRINPDTNSPKINTINPLNSKRIFINFSKEISFSTGLDKNNYYIETIGNPIYVSFDDSTRAAINLIFNEQFVDKQTYSIQISNLQDDCNNQITAINTSFLYKKIHITDNWVINQNQIQLIFSEEIEFISSTSNLNYSVDNNIGNPSSIVRSVTEPNSVYLQFAEPFEDGKQYSISISNIKDVNGNSINDTNINFIYYIAKPKDILINEVLFNPLPNCVDYVELYNNSNYSINLKNLRIANRNSSGDINTFYNIVEQNTYFNPKSYIILTTDSTNVKKTYPVHSNNFIQLKNMPSYPDDNGTIVIFDTKDTIIDEFNYSEKMHFKLISNKEGVALERISFDKPTNDAKNWTSASSFVSFGTPGLQNSQFKKLNDSIENSNFKLENDVFSPDNDGYNDQLFIYYNFDESGYVANIDVVNKNGLLIKNIAKNDYLGTKGYWVWDGVDKNGNRTNPGIYVITIKVFDLEGNYKIHKFPIVISYKK